MHADGICKKDWFAAYGTRTPWLPAESDITAAGLQTLPGLLVSQVQAHLQQNRATVALQNLLILH